MKKLLVGAVLAVSITALAGCQSGERTIKNLQSNYGGGLHRVVSIYAQDGKLLRTYEGNLDIKENTYGNEVLFDLNGKRVTVNNAIVITEEK